MLLRRFTSKSFSSFRSSWMIFFFFEGATFRRISNIIFGSYFILTIYLNGFEFVDI